MGRLPGWVFLMTLCRTFSDSFWFFHLVHACILNYCVFKIIRNSSRFIFSCVLIYFVLIYFEFNFQVIRQSLAVGVFLYALLFYLKNQWIKYYFFVLVAMTIHDSAFILLFLPLVKLVKINEITLTLIFALTLLLIIYSDNVAEGLVGFYVSDEFTERVNYYAARIELGNKFEGYLNYVFNVIVPLFGLFLAKKMEYDIKYKHIIIMYIIIYSVGLSIPIMSRFNQYFLLHYFIFYVDLFYILSLIIVRRVGKKYLLTSFLVLNFIFVSYRSRIYFVPKESGHPTYVQFYPYASIFFQETDEERESFFRRSQ